MQVAALQALQNFTNIHDSDSEGDPLPTTAESEPDIATESTGSSSESDPSDGECEPDTFTTQANQPSSSENSGHRSKCGMYLCKRPATPRPGSINVQNVFKMTPGVTNREKQS